MGSSEKPFTAVEWCAGYAGIHLGLKRAIPNLRVIAFSEIEAFACANLVAKMEAGLLDPAPIWPNLKTFPSAAFANKVDLLVAGYPCQPFSAAGKRLGTEDERHLWPYIADGIRAMRPRFCFFENVEGHITLGLSTVVSDLAEMGYKTTWGVFSASEVGAPHQRKRVFILAYDQDAECQLSGATWSGWSGSANRGSNELAHDIQQGSQGGLSGRSYSGWEGVDGHAGCCGAGSREWAGVWPSCPGEPQYEWEPPRVTGTIQRQEHGGMGNGNGNDELSERGDSEQRQDSTTGRVGAEGRGQTQPPVGLHVDECSGILDRQLIPDGAYGIVDKNIEGDCYATTEKTYAREVLQNLWDQIGTEGLQRTFGRYEDVLAETVLRSGVRLDSFTQRICFFVWCVQASHPIKEWGLSGMRGSDPAWDTPQGQEPIEQLRRELAYALCQLSYEIALERGQEVLETKGTMPNLWGSWETQAWNVSETLPAMEEVWRSTFDEAFRENWIYSEAAHLGYNRVDSLRLLGNGVVPATAARAWEVLYSRLRGDL